jgi:hypothetical protein
MGTVGRLSPCFGPQLRQRPDPPRNLRRQRSLVHAFRHHELVSRTQKLRLVLKSNKAGSLLLFNNAFKFLYSDIFLLDNVEQSFVLVLKFLNLVRIIDTKFRNGLFNLYWCLFV